LTGQELWALHAKSFNEGLKEGSRQERERVGSFEPEWQDISILRSLVALEERAVQETGGFGRSWFRLEDIVRRTRPHVCRKHVCSRVRRLRYQRLVERNGKKGGDRITPKGRELLAKLPKT
jgi:hypothetical protein